MFNNMTFLLYYENKVDCRNLWPMHFFKYINTLQNDSNIRRYHLITEDFKIVYHYLVATAIITNINTKMFQTTE